MSSGAMPAVWIARSPATAPIDAVVSFATATSRPTATNAAEPGAGDPYQTPVSGAVTLGRLGAGAAPGAAPSPATKGATPGAASATPAGDTGATATGFRRTSRVPPASTASSVRSLRSSRTPSRSTRASSDASPGSRADSASDPRPAAASDPGAASADAGSTTVSPRSSRASVTRSTA